MPRLTLLHALTSAALIAACSGAVAEAPSSSPPGGDGGAPDGAPTSDATPTPPDSGDARAEGSTGSCAVAPTSTSIVPTVAAPGCAASELNVDTLTYTTTPSSLALDLYRPKTITKPLVLVVWIHGGGWMSGTRANAEQARWLACNGYAVASVDYRLSDVAPFPAQIQDVKAAIRFLRASAATYQLDPDKFVASGSSAGGHLAALAGVTAGVAALEDLSQGNATVSSRVQAAIALYPPTDFSKMDDDIAASTSCSSTGHHGEATSAESKVLGCTVSEASCASSVAAANPITYVDASDPPFLILQGTEDCTVAPGQSARLRDALHAATGCAPLRLVTGAGHGGPAWVTLEPRAEISAFLAKVFP